MRTARAATPAPPAPAEHEPPENHPETSGETWEPSGAPRFCLRRVRPQRKPRANGRQAYNLGNFMRTLAMPETAEPWSLTSLREKLIKIGAEVVSHGRYVTFQVAEVAVSRQMFAEILSLIARLQPPPAPA
jgi:hypothetical protein